MEGLVGGDSAGASLGGRRRGGEVCLQPSQLAVHADGRRGLIEFFPDVVRVAAYILKHAGLQD